MYPCIEQAIHSGWAPRDSRHVGVTTTRMAPVAHHFDCQNCRCGIMALIAKACIHHAPTIKMNNFYELNVFEAITFLCIAGSCTTVAGRHGVSLSTQHRYKLISRLPSRSCSIPLPQKSGKCPKRGSLRHVNFGSTSRSVTHVTEISTWSVFRYCIHFIHESHRLF